MTFASGIIVSCSSDDGSDIPDSERAEMTIFIHHPMCNLGEFQSRDRQEIDDAIIKWQGLKKVNIFYFVNDSYTGRLYRKEYVNENGAEKVENRLVKEYPLETVDYTTYSGLHTILSDVMAASRTEYYGMIIGCHANGWIPTTEDKSSRSRSFGEGTNDKYNTTYKTLAKAIEATGKKFEFVLTDDCYSQNVEVLYEMRNACKYLIGSVTEIGSEGQPYDKTIYQLLQRNYSQVCEDYYTYYQKTEWNSATMSVIDCSKAEMLRDVVRKINLSDKKNVVNVADIQLLDGYDYYRKHNFQNVFFDMSDYYGKLCADPSLLSEYEAVMKQLVVCNVYTDLFNSAYFPNSYMRPIRTCCGLSCSDPCQNQELQKNLKQTEWYKATH